MEDRTIDQDDVAFLKRIEGTDRLFLTKADKSADILAKNSVTNTANFATKVDVLSDFLSKEK